MKNILFKLIILLIIASSNSCFEKEANKDDIISKQLEREILPFDTHFSYEIQKSIDNGSFSAFDINWKFMNSYPKYTNAVLNQIKASKNSDKKNKEFIASMKIYDEFLNIKKEDDLAIVNERLDKLVILIKKHLGGLNIDSDFKCYSTIHNILRYHEYIQSMLGIKTIREMKYTSIVDFSPMLESDRNIIVVSFLDEQGFYNPDSTLKDICKNIKNTLKENSIIYLFRIKANYDDIKESDLKEIKEYIKNNRSYCDAEYTLAYYNLSIAISKNNRKDFIEATKQIEKLSKWTCCDARALITRVYILKDCEIFKLKTF